MTPISYRMFFTSSSLITPLLISTIWAKFFTSPSSGPQASLPADPAPLGGCRSRASKEAASGRAEITPGDARAPHDPPGPGAMKCRCPLTQLPVCWCSSRSVRRPKYGVPTGRGACSPAQRHFTSRVGGWSEIRRGLPSGRGKFQPLIRIRSLSSIRRRSSTRSTGLRHAAEEVRLRDEPSTADR